MRVDRRQLLKLGAGAVGTVALGVPAIASAQTKGKVRLAYLQLGWAATEIIHKEDLLGKHGWSAEYTPIAGAPVPLLQQLTSRNVDAIDMSFALAAKSFEDGAPFKVTGVATAVLGAIVARKDAGLTKIEDLKGRKVAAIVGTSTFFDVRALTLKGYGLDLQKDTKIVTATAPPTWPRCWPRRTSTPSSPGSPSAIRSCCGATASISPSRSTSGARRPDAPRDSPSTSVTS
jgi:ABC-type nitrate/sulfonate/bicarbonate transport system substrate-binding protein